MTTWFQSKGEIQNDVRTGAPIESEVAAIRSNETASASSSPSPSTEARTNAGAVAHPVMAPIGGGTASYGLILGFKGGGKTHLSLEYLERWKLRGGSWTFVDNKGEYGSIGKLARSGREWSNIALPAIAARQPFGIVVQRSEQLDFDQLWKMLTRVGNQLLVIDEMHNHLRDKYATNMFFQGRSRRLNIIGTTITPKHVSPDYKALVDWCACFKQPYSYYADQVAENFFGGAPGIASQLLELPNRHYLHSSAKGTVVAGQTRPLRLVGV
jgi:hypothetical protein